MILRILPFIIFTFLAISVSSQTEEDLVDIINVVSQHPDCEPLFQIELAGGPYFVILRPDQRNVPSGQQYDNLLLWNLSDDDLMFLDKPVRIMSEGEAIQNGVEPRYLAILSYKMDAESCSMMIHSGILEGERFFQGMFSLHKDFGGWTVTGKNTQIR